MNMIVLDVWGGENSMNHIARYILPPREAMERGIYELSNGFLVNLRMDADFGLDQTFDERLGGTA